MHEVEKLFLHVSFPLNEGEGSGSAVHVQIYLLLLLFYNMKLVIQLLASLLLKFPNTIKQW